MSPLRSRRRILAALPALVAVTGLWSFPLRAQRTVDTMRILCGYPAGSTIDQLCRTIAQRMSGRYAPIVVVDNKPGAAGRLAIDELRKSRADGATMLITPASTVPDFVR